VHGSDGVEVVASGDAAVAVVATSTSARSGATRRNEERQRNGPVSPFTAGPRGTGRLSVVSPSGFRLEGLGMKEALEILGALG